MTLLDTLLMLGQGSKQSDPMINVLFFVAMAGVMYFFMLRPQIKRAKEQKEFANTNNIGDTIITTAGIHGKIVKTFDDGAIGVEIDRNTIIKMEKSSISMEMTTALRKKMSTEGK